jgi:hypothetical protein
MNFELFLEESYLLESPFYQEDHDPLQLRGTGEELVLYTHGHFTKMPLSIKDWLISSWKSTGEDPDAYQDGL